MSIRGILAALLVLAAASPASAQAFATYNNVRSWEFEPKRADVAKVFPASASEINAEAIINCVLGPDRSPTQCRPAVKTSGVFYDLGMAAVQLAGL